MTSNDLPPDIPSCHERIRRLKQSRNSLRSRNKALTVELARLKGLSRGRKASDLSPRELLDRALMRAKRAVWTIEHQCKRIRSDDESDTKFLGRREADWLFLIVMLFRLRRAAKIALHAPIFRGSVSRAIERFDNSLGHLERLRNASEHLDDYIAGVGRDCGVNPHAMELSYVGRETFKFIGGQLDLNDALQASIELCAALKKLETA